MVRHGGIVMEAEEGVVRTIIRTGPSRVNIYVTASKIAESDGFAREKAQARIMNG